MNAKVRIILKGEKTHFMTGVKSINTLYNKFEDRATYIEFWHGEEGTFDGKRFTAKAAFLLDEVVDIQIK